MSDLTKIRTESEDYEAPTSPLQEEEYKDTEPEISPAITTSGVATSEPDLYKGDGGINLDAEFSNSGSVDAVTAPVAPVVDSGVDISSLPETSPVTTTETITPDADPEDTILFPRAMKVSGVIAAKYGLPKLELVGADRPITQSEVSDISGRGIHQVALRGALAGATLDSDDEIGGVVSQFLGGSYIDNFKKYNREKVIMEKEHPALFKSSKFAGMMASAYLTKWAVGALGASAPAFSAAMEAASPAAKIAATSLITAGVGGYEGAMGSPSTLSENPEDVLTRGATGGLVGGAIPGTLIGGGWLAGKAAVPVVSLWSRIDREILKKYRGKYNEVDAVNLNKDLSDVTTGIFETFKDINASIADGVDNWKVAAGQVKEAAEAIKPKNAQTTEALKRIEVPEELALSVVQGMENLKSLVTKESQFAVSEGLAGNTVKAKDVFSPAFADAIKVTKGDKGYSAGSPEQEAQIAIRSYVSSFMKAQSRRIRAENPGIDEKQLIGMISRGNFDVPAEEVKSILRGLDEIASGAWNKGPGFSNTEVHTKAFKKMRDSINNNLGDQFPEYKRLMVPTKDHMDLLSSVEDVLKRTKSTKVVSENGAVTFTGDDSPLVNNLRAIAKDFTEQRQKVLQDFGDVAGVDITSSIAKFNAAQEALRSGDVQNLSAKLLAGEEAKMEMAKLSSLAPVELQEQINAINSLMQSEDMYSLAANKIYDLSMKYHRVTSQKELSAAGKKIVAPKIEWPYTTQQGEISKSGYDKVNSLTGGGRSKTFPVDSLSADRKLIEDLAQFDKTGNLAGITETLDNISLKREFMKNLGGGSSDANTVEAIGGALGGAFGFREGGRAVGASIGRMSGTYGGKATRNVIKLMMRIAGENGKNRALPLFSVMSATPIDSIANYTVEKGTPFYNQLISDIKSDNDLSASQKVRAISSLSRGGFKLLDMVEKEEPKKSTAPAINQLVNKMGG